MTLFKKEKPATPKPASLPPHSLKHPTLINGALNHIHRLQQNHTKDKQKKEAKTANGTLNRAANPSPQIKQDGKVSFLLLISLSN